MVAVIRRRRRCERIARLEYALSLNTCPGRVRGRPGPRRRIWIPAITGSEASESWRWPGLGTRGIGRPQGSAARGIFDGNPPRDRPSDSRLGLAAGFLSFDPAPCVQLGGHDDLRGDIGRRFVARTPGVLMGADHPGVDPDRPPGALGRVGIAAQLVEDPDPGPVS